MGLWRSRQQEDEEEEQQQQQQQSSPLPPVVLDMQCFNDNSNEYIVKEVCVVELNTDTLLLHHIVKPPCEREILNLVKQRESYWVTKHCHGLEWDQGDIKYYPLIDKLRVLLHNRSMIYVKGEQKKSYVLKYLFPNANSSSIVVDVFDIGCPSLSNPVTADNQLRCAKHKSVRHKCALFNCTLLKAWIKRYFEEEEVGEDVVGVGEEKVQPVHSNICILL